MDLLKVVREEAMIKFAGDTSKVDAFVEGFQKEAGGYGWAEAAQKAAQTAGNVAEAAPTAIKWGEILAKSGVGLATGLAGAAMVGGVNSYMSSSSNSALRSQFEKALALVIANNPYVKRAPKDRVKDYAETIFKFAPHVAADPNILGSVLANVIQGEGIDQMTIKNLVDLESLHKENMAYGPLMGIKS